VTVTAAAKVVPGGPNAKMGLPLGPLVPLADTVIAVSVERAPAGMVTLAPLLPVTVPPPVPTMGGPTGG
jgi:hypothetical protein